MAEDKFLIRLGADVTALQNDLQKAQTTVNNFGNKIKSIGNFSIAGMGTAFIAQGLIQSLGGFEAEMSKVKAVTQASQAEFEQLKNNAIELAKSYGVTSKEVATLQLEYARLGFSTSEILNTTKATILLSKATGEDLAKSAQIAGSTLRAFNFDASEMGRITDVMAASFNKSALGLNDFGEAIKYVAPVAAAAGLSFEQTSAMLGVLADNGIKGSMAGTSLRKIISDLGSGAAPILNERLAEMAKQGLSGAAAMDEVGRTAYASLLILSKNADKVTEATTAYKNASGELQKMSDVMQDNLYGDYDKFIGQLDATIQKGGGVIGVLRGITQTATGMVRGLGGDLATPGKHWFLDALGINPNDPALKNGAQSTWEVTKKLKDAQTALTEEQKKAAPVLITIATLEEKLKLANERQRIAAEANLPAINNEIQALQEKIKAMKELGTLQELKQRGPLPTLPDSGSSLDKAVLPGIDALPGKLQAVEISATQARLALESIGEITQIDITGPFISGIETIAEGLGSVAVTGQGFGQAIVKAFAGFMKQVGQMMVVAGLSLKKFKQFAITNPMAAVGAGLAMIAIAGAASAAIANAHQSLSSGGGGGTGSGGSSFSEAATRASVNASTQNDQRLVIQVVAKGKDLVGVYDSAKADNQILRGG